MEPLLIKGTQKTPTVNFNPDKGLLEIKGNSIPENTIEFYKPVENWLEEYGRQPGCKTVVEIQLEYFNTSSSKCILDLFKKLEMIHENKNEVTINWYFEEDDEDMLEAGEDYESILRVPFNIIEIAD